MHEKSILPTLIAKQITGALSAEEQEFFSNWLRQGNNQQLFDRLSDLQNLETYQQALLQIESQKDWESLKDRLQPYKEAQEVNQRLKIVKWLPYVAAAMLVLAISVGLFQNYLSKQSNKQEDFMVPGKETAVLHLSNGETIDLLADTGLISDGSGASAKNAERTLRYDQVDSQAEVLTHVLEVPIGGKYQLVLADGTKVWLNSGTRMTYPTRFTGSIREVSLEGEAFFEVEKSKIPFIIQTQELAVRVMGTSFNLSAYKDDQHISTTLLEGKVKVTSLDGKQSLELRPGQQAFYQRGNNSMALKEVDAQRFAAWRLGKFYFENEKLSDIMRRLSRWYTFKSEFRNAQLKNKRFTGVAIQQEPLHTILAKISETTDIKFDINDDRLIVK